MSSIKLTEHGKLDQADGSTEPVMPHEAIAIGRWGVCSQGRIGHIEGKEILPWGESWVGTGLDGTPWASRNPTVICEKDVALFTARS